MRSTSYTSVATSCTARMLLPTTFVLLLPVTVVAVRGAAWWLAAVVVSWAFASAVWLRPPYSAALRDRRVVGPRRTIR